MYPLATVCKAGLDPWDASYSCLWFLDARTCVDDGSGKASSCPDKVGGADFTQATSGSRWLLTGSPQYCYSNASAVRRLTRSGEDGTRFQQINGGNYTILMRSRTVSANVSAGYHDTLGTGAARVYELNSRDNVNMRRTTASVNEDQSTSHSALTSDTWHTIAAAKYITSGDVYAWLDGAALGTAGTIGTDIVETLSVASMGQVTNLANGGWGFVGAYAKALSDAEVLAIHNVLAAVYV